MNNKELARKTKTELLALAQKAGLSASMKMTKAQLLTLLTSAEQPAAAAREQHAAAPAREKKAPPVTTAAGAKPAPAQAVPRKPLEASPAPEQKAPPAMTVVAPKLAPAQAVPRKPLEAKPAPQKEAPAVVPTTAAKAAQAQAVPARPLEEKPAQEQKAPAAVAGAAPEPVQAWPRERVAIFAWESARGLAEGEIAYDVAEAAAALGRAGMDVHVFTRGAESGPTLMDGVTYHFCGTPDDADILESADRFCAAAADACRLAAAAGGPFQVLHGYEWLTAEAVRACRQEQAARTVMTFHSTEYQRAGGRFDGGVSSRIRAVESAAAQTADRIVAASEEVKQQLQWVYQLPPDKLSVIYCGISAAPVPTAADTAAVKEAYGFRAQDPVFLYIGNLTDEMGPDLLLASVPRILKADRYARFVFVGDGPLRARLEEQVRRDGLSEAVRFTGPMEGEPLQQLLAAAEAVVFPCRSAKPLATVLFAWSAAKPVIVTHTGPAEFVWHDVTGLKVYLSEASLVWGMERVLRDREFGAWLGQNARFAVDDAFTWDAVARKLCDVYHQ